MQRYSRQTVFSPIGIQNQLKLQKSRVAIIGLGALGTVSVNNLCRSGVGFLRIIDRDYVDLTNLQRQIIYTEDDANQNLPKSIAAYNFLTKVNSEITIDPVITDVNSSNIEDLIFDVDLVLDATDNWEIRFLINEACHYLKKTWIFCSALGSEGMTMNIFNNETSPKTCLKCFIPDTALSHSHSCSTFGILNMATSTIASVQSAEAIKILIDSEFVSKKLFKIDLWKNHSAYINFDQNPDCPVCIHAKYKYFNQPTGSYTTAICGSESIQVVPEIYNHVDLSIIAKRLESIGNVSYNQFTLVFTDDKYKITLFRDGRAIIKNAIDESNARSIYTEYLGL